MDSRYETAARLMRLARLLAASHGGLTLDEMAAGLGTKRRTVERMRDALDREIGLEVTVSGVEKRFRIAELRSSGVLAPNADEMGELESVIRTMAARQPERARLLSSLKEKIDAVLKPEMRRRLASDSETVVEKEAEVWSPGLGADADQTPLRIVRDALRRGLRLSFDYAGGSAAGRRRTETPLGLLYGRKTFLVARGSGERGPVQFRLDRMTAIAVSEETAGAADFDLHAFAAQSFGVMQNDPHDVVLKVKPHAATDAARWRFHPRQSVERHADGTLTVRFRAGGMQELAWHLFTWGEGVEVLAPQALRAILVRELERCLAHHRTEAG